jgi:hypothetical protein
LEAAHVSQQRALAIEEEVYGPEHPEGASTLGNLGTVQQQVGELGAARECARRAIAIFERSFGSEDPRSTMARALLASIGKGSDGGTAPARLWGRWSRLRRGK